MNSFQAVPARRANALRAVAQTLALVAIAAVATQPALAARTENPSRTEIQRMVIEEALNSQVRPSLALAVARVESNFWAQAESSAGARGVMQIMPRTGRGEYGVDAEELWDPRLNIQLGIDFLERLIERYGGRWDLALSHYNGGSVRGTYPNAKPLPVTRSYVDSVLRWEKRYRAQADVWQVAERSRHDGWVAARTRVARIPELPAASLEPRKPPRVESDSKHSSSLWRWSETNALDDFTRDFEERIARVRPRIDDFPPAPPPEG